MSSTARILVVEDEEGLLKLICRTLNNAGFETTGASTGADALEQFRADPELMVLLDQKLPDMRGSELVTRLTEEGYSVPFIVMTGFGDERLAVEMMKLGASDYLVKGLELIDLLPGACRRLALHVETEKRLRQTEASLRHSLEERDVLLREIHHRVKNNLNVVSSLLNLQSSFISSPDQAMEAFATTRDRIMVMALVHEELFSSPELARITMGHYIAQLAHHIWYGHEETERIRLVSDTDDTSLGIDTAVPCGLILNELVTNALKHAFPGERTGLVQVKFVTRENQCLLSVEDDGVGFVRDCDGPNRLGLCLVESLVEQIGGVLHIDRGAGVGAGTGTTVSVHFAGLDGG